MDKKAIDPEIRREFLATFFFRYDKKKEGIVRKNDFFRILQNDLHIMISSETFKILWVAIDEDLSGGLDLEEVLHLFDMKKDEVTNGGTNENINLHNLTIIQPQPYLLLAPTFMYS